MLRTSQSFSSYNFREYFIRRTKDTFRTIKVCIYVLFPDCNLTIDFYVNKAESDPNKVGMLYSDAVKEFAVLRRSAIVNQLYGGWKLAIEVEKKPQEFKTRGDN